MTNTENPAVLDFELRHPQDAAALWAQITDGSRITVTTSEAAALYYQLVLHRLSGYALAERPTGEVIPGRAAEGDSAEPRALPQEIPTMRRGDGDAAA